MFCKQIVEVENSIFGKSIKNCIKKINNKLRFSGLRFSEKIKKKNLFHAEDSSKLTLFLCVKRAANQINSNQ